MTAATGLSDVGPVYCRAGVACLENRGHVAISGMAIKAGGSFASVSDRDSMKALVVVRMRFGMKEGSAQVGQSLAAGMTALALERWKVR